MAIRLLHLADLHLGAGGGFQGDKGEARRKDFTAAFDQAVELALAVETRVDAVLICGDLFDTHAPPPALVSHVQDQFSRLREQDIPVMLVPGFHDAIVYPDSVYRTETFPGAHLLIDPHLPQPITFDIKNTRVHFYGLAWNEPQASVADAFGRKAEDGLHIALLHADVAADVSGSPAPLCFPLAELEGTGMHYVALGYRHDHAVVHEGNVTMAYAGTLEAYRPHETEPRAFLIVSLDTGHDPHLTLTRLPYRSRPTVRQAVDVSRLDLDDHHALAGYLMRYADPQAIMQLELVGTADFIIDGDKLRELLSPHFFWLDVDDRTVFSASSVVRLLASERTIRGLFAHQVLMQAATEPSAEGQAVLEHALKYGLQRFLEGELL